jgi:hypothetical protein
MANGLFSSGIWLNGDRAPLDLRKSSIDCDAELESPSFEEAAFLS